LGKEEDQEAESLCVERNYLDTLMDDEVVEDKVEEIILREVTSAGKLETKATKDFRDLAAYGIVDVVGDDTGGRKIIVVSASKFPAHKHFNNECFLRYLMATLDQYVNMDYSLVYFHHGLTSKTKPPLSWIWGLYKVLDRRYKKNLKSCFIVHPTSFIRVAYKFFKPIISAKFGQKIQYVDHLSDLSRFMNLDRLPIPNEVLEFDRKKNNSSRQIIQRNHFSWTPSQQFGVNVEWILGNHKTEIPPIMAKCVSFLSHSDCLETEGIFRRSANTVVVRELQAKINNGEDVEFKRIDVHIAAVLLKTFLGELSQPLLTYELFESILHFSGLSKESRLSYCQDIVIKKLPDQNHVIVKYIVQFLSLVVDRADMNKMTAANLAVVFGPNLVWSKDKMLSLSSIGPINTFTEFLFSNMHKIFSM